jgi:glycogen operon protein
VDDNFLVIFNASEVDIDWTIPGAQWSRKWTIDLDTADPRNGSARTVNKRAGDRLAVVARSMAVLRSISPASAHPAHRRRAAAVGTAPPPTSTTDTDTTPSVPTDPDPTAPDSTLPDPPHEE